MALSKKTIKATPHTFNKQDGGLVQMGFGGWLKKNFTSNQGNAHPDAGKPVAETSDFGKWLRGSNGPDGKSAGKLISNIYDIGSYGLDMVMPGTGQIMRGMDSMNLNGEQPIDGLTQQPYANQPVTRNPFTPTFAMGGEIGPGTSSSVVTNNLWTPQTRTSIYPYLAQKGLLGHGADSVTMDQWNRFTPDQTLQYVKPDQGIDYTIGNTANPGGIKYWSLDKVPAVNGSSIRRSKFSGNYLDAKKRTNYAVGGIIPAMQPNVEVEGGEVTQGNDGSMAKINGPKHSSGGVPLYIENGGRVFSDKIINPETGRTFAEDADRLRKMMK